eukprot:CAMPEP_0172530888 /NCGR_PEP_ID=MMETSP1067-20121228/4494_1 /TAXON_ID=265564 ORGANISM="Thalassiosira punctigera, Strain Tpunct2005C2" /NCGR_SAMPLE_ID=MMETSP1067 /ASSEMBLY_ACC=CAM_ASM_000444 /LENGTH=385 /DNA_ID=CAMNT_0013315187 /DNA_START=54 /DNA_END=1211 /DNA_ORIENTATION=+
MTTRARRRTTATTRRAATALAILATISICPSRTESLAFDVSSRSSSSFASSRSAQLAFRPRESFNDDRRCRKDPSDRSLEMKVTSSSRKKGRNSKSSLLTELNNERLRAAGRPGTKKFTDPNKVFLGNLPYDAVESEVYELFAKHWNVPAEAVGDRIESVKIIRDWKTGKSKGYGFIQFYEPMVATSAMESINKGTGRGWRIKGRRIRLDQGKRKPSDDDANKKNKKRVEKMELKDLDEEGLVIHSALEEAEGTAGFEGREDDDDEEDGMSEDQMIAFIEKGGLREVMPLTEETAGFLGIEGLYDEDDFDEPDYDELFDEDEEEEDDGEEIVYDGVFEEEYNPDEYEGLTDEEEEERTTMNREQRRAADKKRKKRKLPFKGFGSG